MKRSHYLVGALAIAALVAASSASVTIAQTSSPAPAVTFHKDVEPILQKNCQSCHRPGQIAPPVTGYGARPARKNYLL